MRANQTPVDPDDTTPHRPPRSDERGPCPHCGETMGRPIDRNLRRANVLIALDLERLERGRRSKATEVYDERYFARRMP